jgi:cobalamin biosynthesis Mg chelatase CobN
MAIDLVGLVSRVLTPQLVGSLARAVGINEGVAQKLVSAAIPVILGALATTAAAPGGARKLVDAVSNSDPDLLTKLSSAISAGNVRALTDGANRLGSLLGGSGVSSIVGALSQFSGATQPGAQSAIGAVAQAAIGAIGQQDPSVWSDPSSIASMFGAQKNAIAAALPGELSSALGATGLLAGLGGLGAAATRTASSAASGAASATSAATSAAARAPATGAAARASPAASSHGFPMWAIILLIVIVLAAIWWFMSQKQTEPAKQGMLPPPGGFAFASLA